jgi:hypothetical protein
MRNIALALVLLTLMACRLAVAPAASVEPRAPGVATESIPVSAASAPQYAPAPPLTRPSAPTVASFAAKIAPDARWLVASGQEKGFRRLTLEGTGTVRIRWTRAATRVGLAVERDGNRATVDFGEALGEVEPEGATLCKRLGYRLSNGAELETLRVDGLVSIFSVGNMSGSDEMLVVLGPGVLYVLHAYVSDGMCEKRVTEGPLTVCRGEEYARLAEVRLEPVLMLEESIDLATDDAVNPFDCATPTLSGSLIPP